MRVIRIEGLDFVSEMERNPEMVRNLAQGVEDISNQESTDKPNWPDEEQGTREIVERLIDEHEDAGAAIEMLEKMAEDDPALRESLGYVPLNTLCRRVVYARLRDRRAQILNGAGQALVAHPTDSAPATFLRSGGHSRIDAQGEGAADSLESAIRARYWMDLTLPVTHKPLAKATDEDLRQAVEYYSTREKVYKQRKQAFKKILAKVKPGKQVSECLSEQALGEMFNA